MQATCQTCGKGYEAKRRTSKFCSDHCRIRAHRAPKREGPKEGRAAAAAPPVAAARPGAAPAAPPAPAGGGIIAATQRELTAAGRLDTANGQAAMLLAELLGGQGVDTGSSTAALVREHRAALAAAVADAEQAADPVDELLAKRQQRRAQQ